MPCYLSLQRPPFPSSSSSSSSLALLLTSVHSLGSSALHIHNAHLRSPKGPPQKRKKEKSHTSPPPLPSTPLFCASRICFRGGALSLTFPPALSSASHPPSSSRPSGARGGVQTTPRRWRRHTHSFPVFLALLLSSSPAAALVGLHGPHLLPCLPWWSAVCVCVCACVRGCAQFCPFFFPSLASSFLMLFLAYLSLSLLLRCAEASPRVCPWARAITRMSPRVDGCAGVDARR